MFSYIENFTKLPFIENVFKKCEENFLSLLTENLIFVLVKGY